MDPGNKKSSKQIGIEPSWKPVEQSGGEPSLKDSNHSSFQQWIKNIMESSRSASSCSNATASDMCDPLGEGSSPYPICKYESCEREGKLTCIGCFAEYYCSRECQKKDWKSHRLECKSSSLINEKQPEGGYATTLAYDVKAGEVLSNEKPLVVLPCKSASPDVAYCINCGIRLKLTTPPINMDESKGNVSKPNCELCDWPCCPGGCVMTDNKQKSRHSVLECAELNEAARTGTLMWIAGESLRYHFLWILRMALLKKRDPERFSKMMELADFVGHKKVSYMTMDIFGKLHNALPVVLTSVGSTELVNIFKILCHRFLPMNFDLETPAGEGKKVRGLYYQSSIIRHSCFPNLGYNTDSHNQQRIYALKTLEAGTSVSVSYDPDGIFLTTYERRKRLLERHNIWCDCERCSDSTEFQTYYSVLPCKHHSGNASYLFPSGKDFAKARRSPDSFQKGFSIGWSWKPEAYVMMVDPTDESKGIICSTGKACPGYKELKTTSWTSYEERVVKEFLSGLEALPFPSDGACVAKYLTSVYTKKLLPCTTKIFFDTSRVVLEDLFHHLPNIGLNFIYSQLFLKFVVPAESVYRIFKVFHNENVTISARSLRVASIIRLAHIAYDIRTAVISMTDLEQRIRQIWITQKPVELTTITQSNISSILETIKTQGRHIGIGNDDSNQGAIVDKIEACAAAFFYSSFGDLLRRRRLERLFLPVTCRQESSGQ